RKEAIIFRRAMRQVARDDLDRVVSRISAYNKEEFAEFMEGMKNEGNCSCGGAGAQKTDLVRNNNISKTKEIQDQVLGNRVHANDNRDSLMLQKHLGKAGQKISKHPQLQHRRKHVDNKREKINNIKKVEESDKDIPEKDTTQRRSIKSRLTKEYLEKGVRKENSDDRFERHDEEASKSRLEEYNFKFVRKGESEDERHNIRSNTRDRTRKSDLRYDSGDERYDSRRTRSKDCKEVRKIKENDGDTFNDIIRNEESDDERHSTRRSTRDKAEITGDQNVSRRTRSKSKEDRKTNKSGGDTLNDRRCMKNKNSRIDIQRDENDGERYGSERMTRSREQSDAKTRSDNRENIELNDEVKGSRIKRKRSESPGRDIEVKRESRRNNPKDIEKREVNTKLSVFDRLGKSKKQKTKTTHTTVESQFNEHRIEPSDECTNNNLTDSNKNSKEIASEESLKEFLSRVKNNINQDVQDVNIDVNTSNSHDNYHQNYEIIQYENEGDLEKIDKHPTFAQDTSESNVICIRDGTKQPNFISLDERNDIPNTLFAQRMKDRLAKETGKTSETLKARMTSKKSENIPYKNERTWEKINAHPTVAVDTDEANTNSAEVCTKKINLALLDNVNNIPNTLFAQCIKDRLTESSKTNHETNVKDSLGTENVKKVLLPDILKNLVHLSNSALQSSLNVDALHKPEEMFNNNHFALEETNSNRKSNPTDNNKDEGNVLNTLDNIQYQKPAASSDKLTKGKEVVKGCLKELLSTLKKSNNTIKQGPQSVPESKYMVANNEKTAEENEKDTVSFGEKEIETESTISSQLKEIPAVSLGEKEIETESTIYSQLKEIPAVKECSKEVLSSFKNSNVIISQEPKTGLERKDEVSNNDKIVEGNKKETVSAEEGILKKEQALPLQVNDKPVNFDKVFDSLEDILSGMGLEVTPKHDNDTLPVEFDKVQVDKDMEINLLVNDNACSILTSSFDGKFDNKHITMIQSENNDKNKTPIKPRRSKRKSKEGVKNDDENVSKSESTVSKSESTVSKSESTVIKSELAASKSEISASKSEIAASKSEIAASKSESAASKSESAASKSESAASKSESAASKSERAASKSERAASKSERAASRTERTASRTERTASRSERTASGSERTASKSKIHVSKSKIHVSKSKSTADKYESTVKKDLNVTKQNISRIKDENKSKRLTDVVKNESLRTLKSGKVNNNRIESDSSSDEEVIRSKIRKSKTERSKVRRLRIESESSTDEEVIQEDILNSPINETYTNVCPTQDLSVTEMISQNKSLTNECSNKSQINNTCSDKTQTNNAHSDKSQTNNNHSEKSQTNNHSEKSQSPDGNKNSITVNSALPQHFRKRVKRKHNSVVLTAVSSVVVNFSPTKNSNENISTSNSKGKSEMRIVKSSDKVSEVKVSMETKSMRGVEDYNKQIPVDKNNITKEGEIPATSNNAIERTSVELNETMNMLRDLASKNPTNQNDENLKTSRRSEKLSKSIYESQISNNVELKVDNVLKGEVSQSNVRNKFYRDTDKDNRSNKDNHKKGKMSKKISLLFDEDVQENEKLSSAEESKKTICLSSEKKKKVSKDNKKINEKVAKKISSLFDEIIPSLTDSNPGKTDVNDSSNKEAKNKESMSSSASSNSESKHKNIKLPEDEEKNEEHCSLKNKRISEKNHDFKYEYPSVEEKLKIKENIEVGKEVLETGTDKKQTLITVNDEETSVSKEVVSPVKMVTENMDQSVIDINEINDKSGMDASYKISPRKENKNVKIGLIETLEMNNTDEKVASDYKLSPSTENKNIILNECVEDNETKSSPESGCIKNKTKFSDESECVEDNKTKSSEESGCIKNKPKFSKESECVGNDKTKSTKEPENVEDNQTESSKESENIEDTQTKTCKESECVQDRITKSLRKSEYVEDNKNKSSKESECVKSIHNEDFLEIFATETFAEETDIEVSPVKKKCNKSYETTKKKTHVDKWQHSFSERFEIESKKKIDITSSFKKVDSKSAFGIEERKKKEFEIESKIDINKEIEMGCEKNRKLIQEKTKSAGDVKVVKSLNIESDVNEIEPSKDKNISKNKTMNSSKSNEKVVCRRSPRKQQTQMKKDNSDDWFPSEEELLFDESDSSDQNSDLEIPDACRQPFDVESMNTENEKNEKLSIKLIKNDKPKNRSDTNKSAKNTEDSNGRNQKSLSKNISKNSTRTSSRNKERSLAMLEKRDRSSPSRERRSDRKLRSPIRSPEKHSYQKGLSSPRQKRMSPKGRSSPRSKRLPESKISPKSKTSPRRKEVDYRGRDRTRREDRKQDVLPINARERSTRSRRENMHDEISDDLRCNRNSDRRRTRHSSGDEKRSKDDHRRRLDYKNRPRDRDERLTEKRGRSNERSKEKELKHDTTGGERKTEEKPIICQISETKTVDNVIKTPVNPDLIKKFTEERSTDVEDGELDEEEEGEIKEIEEPINKVEKYDSVNRSRKFSEDQCKKDATGSDAKCKDRKSKNEDYKIKDNIYKEKHNEKHTKENVISRKECKPKDFEKNKDEVNFGKKGEEPFQYKRSLSPTRSERSRRRITPIRIEDKRESKYSHVRRSASPRKYEQTQRFFQENSQQSYDRNTRRRVITDRVENSPIIDKSKRPLRRIKPIPVESEPDPSTLFRVKKIDAPQECFFTKFMSSIGLKNFERYDEEDENMDNLEKTKNIRNHTHSESNECGTNIRSEKQIPLNICDDSEMSLLQYIGKNHQKTTKYSGTHNVDETEISESMQQKIFAENTISKVSTYKLEEIEKYTCKENSKKSPLDQQKLHPLDPRLELLRSKNKSEVVKDEKVMSQPVNANGDNVATHEEDTCNSIIDLGKQLELSSDVNTQDSNSMDVLSKKGNVNKELSAESESSKDNSEATAHEQDESDTAQGKDESDSEDSSSSDDSSTEDSSSCPAVPSSSSRSSHLPSSASRSSHFPSSASRSSHTNSNSKSSKPLDTPSSVTKRLNFESFKIPAAHNDENSVLPDVVFPLQQENNHVALQFGKQLSALCQENSDIMDQDKEIKKPSTDIGHKSIEMDKVENNSDIIQAGITKDTKIQKNSGNNTEENSHKTSPNKEETTEGNPNSKTGSDQINDRHCNQEQVQEDLATAEDQSEKDEETMVMEDLHLESDSDSDSDPSDCACSKCSNSSSSSSSSSSSDSDTSIESEGDKDEAVNGKLHQGSLVTSPTKSPSRTLRRSPRKLPQKSIVQFDKSPTKSHSKSELSPPKTPNTPKSPNMPNIPEVNVSPSMPRLFDSTPKKSPKKHNISYKKTPSPHKKVHKSKSPKKSFDLSKSQTKMKEDISEKTLSKSPCKKLMAQQKSHKSPHKTPCKFPYLEKSTCKVSSPKTHGKSPCKTSKPPCKKLILKSPIKSNKTPCKFISPVKSPWKTSSPRTPGKDLMTSMMSPPLSLLMSPGKTVSHLWKSPKKSIRKNEPLLLNDQMNYMPFLSPSGENIDLIDENDIHNSPVLKKDENIIVKDDELRMLLELENLSNEAETNENEDYSPNNSLNVTSGEDESVLSALALSPEETPARPEVSKQDDITPKRGIEVTPRNFRKENKSEIDITPKICAMLLTPKTTKLCDVVSTPKVNKGADIIENVSITPKVSLEIQATSTPLVSSLGTPKTGRSQLLQQEIHMTPITTDYDSTPKGSRNDTTLNSNKTFTDSLQETPKSSKTQQKIEEAITSSSKLAADAYKESGSQSISQESRDETLRIKSVDGVLALHTDSEANKGIQINNGSCASKQTSPVSPRKIRSYVTATGQLRVRKRRTNLGLSNDLSSFSCSQPLITSMSIVHTDEKTLINKTNHKKQLFPSHENGLKRSAVSPSLSPKLEAENVPHKKIKMMSPRSFHQNVSIRSLVTEGSSQQVCKKLLTEDSNINITSNIVSQGPIKENLETSKQSRSSLTVVQPLPSNVSSQSSVVTKVKVKRRKRQFNGSLAVSDVCSVVSSNLNTSPQKKSQ
ncbi:unnamed protein product, partial [Meganyctiphanes norvegica]